MRSVRSHFGWYWPTLGLAGSVLIALAGADVLRQDPINWWFAPHFAGARPLVYVGMGALAVAWLALGRRLPGAGAPPTGALLVIGAIWSLPLLAGPVLFSRDMFSYLAQGTIVHHGLDPYSHGPIVLARLHDYRVLSAVSPFWRHTTAPYGPAFLALASLIAAISGSHLILGTLLLRALELPGLVLLAVFTPRLARRLGTDPARAIWLVLLSPLVLLELVAAGHNDALMVGLLLAGVTLALERRPLLGIAVCAAAATIKLPAAGGALFIAICWARADRENAARHLAAAALVAAAVLALITAISGLGFGWISGGVLSTPGRVRLAITPGTAIGYTLYSLVHAFPSTMHGKAFEFAATRVTLALAAAFALFLAWRVRFETLAWCLGLALVAVAIGGPAAWPWYATWGLVLLAACAPAQRSPWLPIVIAISVFVVKPNGQLALTLSSAPYVLLVYIAAGLIWWRRRSRGPREVRTATLAAGAARS